MPQYIFECPKCEGRSLVQLKIDDRDKEKIRCSECQTLKKRVIAETSFQLMGGGWARDGYEKKPDRYVNEQIKQNRKKEGASDAEAKV